MTRAEFLVEFTSAVRKPAVRLCGAGSRLRWQVEPSQVVVDAVGLVWWGRTGTMDTGRFVQSLKYALALGLAVEDALELLAATDNHPETWGEGSALWREGLERAMGLSPPATTSG